MQDAKKHATKGVEKLAEGSAQDAGELGQDTAGSSRDPHEGPSQDPHDRTLAAEPAKHVTQAKKEASKRVSTDRMGTERIGKLLFEFSLPAIVSMVFNTLYNVVDTAVLGWCVGEVGVAVTTLALPVMTILMGFSMLAGQGGNALAAIQLGERNVKRVERTLGNSAVLLFGMSAAVAISAFVFIDPVLALIGTTSELYEPTKTFVQIICVFFAFQSLGMGLNNFLRTAGKPVLSLVTMVLGTVMCIVFNLLFVAVLGLGVAGSAWATVCGQACGMIPVLWYFICSKSAPFKLRLSCCKPDLALMGKIMSLGVASFVMQVASTVVTIVFNQVVTKYGAMDALGAEGALAAIGVAQKATMFAITPMIGLTMGAQPLVGYNYGAHNWDRVLKTLKWAEIWGTGFGTFFLALAHLIPVQVVSLFGISGDLRDFAVLSLQIYTILYPLVGFQIIGSSYFQSSGQPMKAAVLELTRQVIFLIPLYVIMPHLAWVFGMSQLSMVIVAVPCSDALSVCVTSAFVALEVRKLRRLRAAAARPASQEGQAEQLALQPERAAMGPGQLRASQGRRAAEEPGRLKASELAQSVPTAPAQTLQEQG